jgi:hypothetical protein
VIIEPQQRMHFQLLVHPTRGGGAHPLPLSHIIAPARMTVKNIQQYIDTVRNRQNEAKLDVDIMQTDEAEGTHTEDSNASVEPTYDKYCIVWQGKEEKLSPEESLGSVVQAVRIAVFPFVRLARSA